MTPADKARIAELQQLLTAGDTGTQARAAIELAEIASREETEIVVTRHDKYWQPAGEIGAYLELSAAIPRNLSPSATLVLNGGDGYSTEGSAAPDPHIPALENCRQELVGLTIEIGAVRWAGYVDYTDYEFKGGKRTLTATCVGIYDVLYYIFVWPDPAFPIQAQPFSHAVYVGPIVSCIEYMCATQILRIQSGIWQFINNALSLNPDLRAWIANLLDDNKNIFEALKTPIYVKRTNILKDTSMLIARTVRMESLGEVIADMTKAYGVDVRMDLWRPGDPQPDKHANLTKPTYVLSVTDRLTTTGPFKNVLDSIVKTVVDTAGSFFGEIGGLIERAPGMDGVFLSRLAGVDFEQPIAVLVDGPDTALLEFKIHNRHPRGGRQIIGGRSPKWVGAPRLTAGGHRPTGLTLRQRPDQRHPRVADRQPDDPHRNHRCAKQSARRLPQRCLPRLPAHRQLQPPAERRSIRAPGAVHRDRLVAVQYRSRVHFCEPVLRHPGLAGGDREVPQQQALWAGHPLRAGRPDVAVQSRRVVHRLRRGRLHPRQPQGARRDHRADRRPQSP